MLTQHQRERLESLYRQAVLLGANPAGGQAYCEAACRRIGSQAHHAIHRSQEPGLRLLFEPRFGVWLCGRCHTDAHATPNAFLERLLEILRRTNPRKANCLWRYSESHDRLRAPSREWRWMLEYLRRCIARRERCWSDAYNQDVVYGDFA